LKCVLAGRKHKLKLVEPVNSGHTVEFSKETKHLGVVLVDSKLLWNPQIKRVKEGLTKRGHRLAMIRWIYTMVVRYGGLRIFCLVAETGEINCSYRAAKSADIGVLLTGSMIFSRRFICPYIHLPGRFGRMTFARMIFALGQISSRQMSSVQMSSGQKFFRKMYFRANEFF
jgi:hypothetical protein